MRMTAIILVLSALAATAQAQTTEPSTTPTTTSAQDEQAVMDAVIHQVAQDYSRDLTAPSDAYASYRYTYGPYLHESYKVHSSVVEAGTETTEFTPAGDRPLDLRIDPRWFVKHYGVVDARYGLESSVPRFKLQLTSSGSMFNDDQRYYSTVAAYIPDNNLQYDYHQYRIGVQNRTDDLADRVFPGFGRFETRFFDLPVRIDYINSRRCGKSRTGVCLSAKW